MRKLIFFIVMIASVLFAQRTDKKVVFFIAKDFPAKDIPALSEGELLRVAADFNSQIFTDVESLNNFLNKDTFSLLVLPYGSAFPVDAWQTIYNFITSGGSIVNIGGSPFYHPIIRKDSTWIEGIPQQTFARKLLIGPTEKIELNSEPFYYNNQISFLNNFSIDKNEIPVPSVVYELTYRLTTQKDFPREDGTSGPREAIVRPLIHISNKNGYSFAAPIVEIDRLYGSSNGARWIFYNNNAKPSKKLIKKLIERALLGAIEFTANPALASLRKGETPLIRVNLFLPNNKTNAPVKINLRVVDENKKQLLNKSYELIGTEDFKTSTISLDGLNNLAEGFYTVNIEAENISNQPNKVTTGFWVQNYNYKTGPKITVSKDWLRKDGKVFPVIGTTYMASDVHRKFLFEPNPFVWMKDFELMKKSGINFIRTGLWNSWTRAMLDRGAIDESFLRALDAYVMTAIKNEIVVCFNFFAFTPPLNGGTNPYLDPRSLDWQKTFITLITTRYKNVNWVHYDLINEPSYSPPNDIWKNSPVGDPYEKAEWQKWLNTKYRFTNTELMNKWRDAIGDVYQPPSESELYYRTYKEDRRPRKTIDFNLFTQDVVTNWAEILTKTIKSVSNTLVTLGQDEGGTSIRPSQQFHFTAVDYTSVHTWWLNDDLLWDGLMTKVPEKPNLVSETGIMRLEDIDGEFWRTPVASKNLLDRKFAFSFGSRSAGFVQWAWNINPYMPIDNESVIGFFRPDGTAKIEIENLLKYAKFFSAIQNYIDDYEPTEVAIIIPHSKIFAGRKNGDLSTKRFVRTITDHFGITPSLISEYKLTPERFSGVKLVIVPSAEFINDDAANVLYDLSQKGKKVLFTGPLEGNSYGEISENILKLGLVNKSIPVSLFEKYFSNNRYIQEEINITFDNQQSEFIKKSVAPKFYWNNNIYHEPLPVELAREREPLIDLLKNVFNLSNVKYQFDEVPLSTNILEMKNYFLIVLINESSFDITKTILLMDNPVTVTVKSGQSKLMFVDKQTGNIIAETD